MSDVIKVEDRKSTVFCESTGSEESLNCKMFKKPKKPIARKVGEDQYKYVRHKPAEEGEFVELEPDEEWESDALQAIGPAVMSPRPKFGTVGVTGFGDITVEPAKIEQRFPGEPGT